MTFCDVTWIVKYSRKREFNMDNKSFRNLLKGIIILLLIVIQNVTIVKCASISVQSLQGYLNEPLIVQGRYTLNSGQSLRTIIVSRRRSSDNTPVPIVSFSPTDTAYYQAAAELQQRSSLNLTGDSANINIQSLQCVDEAVYTFDLQYDCNGQICTETATMLSKLIVKGRAEKPYSLTQEPQAVAEYDEFTFTCRSVVGKDPQGSVIWKSVLGAEITDLSGAEDSISDTTGSCTKTVVSVLRLNVSRDSNGMQIRCRTIHDDVNITDPNYFQDSNPLQVYYPVEPNNIVVSQNPELNAHEEGTQVKILCIVSSVPAATYKWVHVETGSSFDVGTSGEKVFNNIRIADQGRYRCEAQNVYLNKTYNGTKFINIVVEKRTTSASTVTPGVSPTTPGGGATDKTTQPDDDQTTIIIIVVCVVLFVAIVVAIVVFLIYRRRRNDKGTKIKVSTPPEKPANKNPAINTFPTSQPDLVNDEKKMYPNNAFYSPHQSYNNYSHNNSFDMKNDDISSYSDLNFDDRPRSRKPLALSEDDYTNISMPHV